jgi:hypothetical protein
MCRLAATARGAIAGCLATRSQTVTDTDDLLARLEAIILFGLRHPLIQQRSNAERLATNARMGELRV